MIDPHLVNDYLVARYIVKLDDKELVFRVGQKYSELAELMDFFDCDRALFITPCNPQSEQLSATENEQRFQALQQEVQRHTSFKGYGVDDAESWPREESLLVLGLEETQQASLAHQFGQNAYVSIDRDGLLSLWVIASSDDLAEPCYEKYQRWGEAIPAADTYSMLPQYPYPVFFDDGLKTPTQVVAHWRSNFERIVSLADEEFEAMTPVLECYAAWLVEHAKGAGYWSVLSDERMPSDARTDFIKIPTCIALATLVYLRNHMPQLTSQQRQLEKLITRVSHFIMRRNAWLGNGYDRFEVMSDLLDIFGRAGVIDEWLAREPEFPELVSALREVAESMGDDSEAWCGEQAGYSRIDSKQFGLVEKALSPILRGSLPMGSS
ncbi:hypothetical protein imdm_1012 [gamma proteobacterium IMCC2047]|nr:hypothetical protein imdm_1012 [gamma proteobacterium IMCC2047]